MLTLVYPAHHRLRNSEFIRFAKDVVTVCTQNDPPVLIIQDQVVQFGGTIDELNRLFKIAQGNVLTAELQAIDDRRDKALIGIRLDAESKLYHYSPETVKAAQLVLATYDKYGKSLHRLNYYAETEVVESLSGDFTTEPELAAALRLLHLEEWAAELNAANQQFNQTFIARSGSNAARPDGNLAQQRAVCIEQYEVLARHIVAHHTLSPSPAYDKLVLELNDTINGFNLLVAKRAASRLKPLWNCPAKMTPMPSPLHRLRMRRRGSSNTYRLDESQSGRVGFFCGVICPSTASWPFPHRDG